MRTIKIGVIGAGGIAQTHMTALQQVEGIEVVAICDLIRERAETTARKYGVPRVFVDYHDLLKIDEIEAVSVLTYNQQHCAPSVDALQAGKHVLVEKPMAATLADAVTMTKAAHAADKILMVALKNRYSPHMIAARQIAASGELGDIYYAESVACRRNGIPGWPGASFVYKDKAGLGTVADIGVYALDASLFVMGHPKPVAVSGIANNLLGTKYSQPVKGSWGWDPKALSVEDFGAGAVRFEDGQLMIFKTCWIMNMDTLGGTLWLGTKAGMRLDPLTVYQDRWGTMNDIKVDVPKVENIELFKSENLAFADAIRNNQPSPIPADEMLITNVIIQGMIDSAAAGHEVHVSVPEV